MTTTHTAHPKNDDIASFGALLRSWREVRKCSQLDLALDAQVSQRHVSFLESGRALPSREMVLQLAIALDIPLRERNMLLRTAGFAPLYQERTLENNDMLAVRQALEMTLRHHEPYPAVVINRQWDLKLKNAAADRFLSLLGDQNQLWQTVDPSGDRNVMRFTFHPNGMQPFIKNWDQVAGLLISHLQRELAADPANPKLQSLVKEIIGHANLSKQKLSVNWASSPPPVVPMELNLGSLTLKVFSMISTFGTALDITAEEMRVETFFPADDATEQFFRQLAAV